MRGFTRTYLRDTNIRIAIVLVLLLLLLILIKSFVTFQHSPYFTPGCDAIRHAALIQGIAEHGNIYYARFHNDGSPRAYEYYTPAFHTLVAETVLLANLDVKFAMNLYSFVLHLFFLLAVVNTMNILLPINHPDKYISFVQCIYSILIVELLLPILEPRPFSFVILLLMPLLFWLYIVYIKSGLLKYLALIGIVSGVLSLTHQTIIVWILTVFIMLSVSVMLKYKFVHHLRLMFVVLFSSIGGLILYFCTIDNYLKGWSFITYYQFNKIENIYLFKNLFKIVVPNSIPVFIALLVFIGILWLGIEYAKQKNQLHITKRYDNFEKYMKYLNSANGIFLVLTIISFIITVILDFIAVIASYFTPPIDGTAVGIGINAIRLRLNFLAPLINTTIPISLVYMLYLLYFKEKIKEDIDLIDVILYFVVIFPFIFVILSVKWSEFITVSYRVFQCFIVLLFVFGVSMLLKILSNKNRRSFKLILVVCLVYFVAYSIVYPIVAPEYWQSVARTEGYWWLINNTPIYVDEKSGSKHFATYGQTGYIPLTYDARGYFHNVKFSHSYSLKNAININIVKIKENEYIPCIDVFGYSNICLKFVRWRDYPVFKFSNEIYNNDNIIFFKY